MSLNCPRCGANLSLNLSLNGVVEPQVVAQPQRVGGVSSSSRARYVYNDKDFQTFWATYPRRVGKASAFSVWSRVIREVEPQVVIEAAAQYAAQVEGLEAQYIKYPEGWLKAGRWDDETPVAPAPAGEGDPAFLVGTPEWLARIQAEEDAAIHRAMEEA